VVSLLSAYVPDYPMLQTARSGGTVAGVWTVIEFQGRLSRDPKRQIERARAGTESGGRMRSGRKSVETAEWK